jgi:hypothetical protein
MLLASWHDPEKEEAGFPRSGCPEIMPKNEIERDNDSKKRHPARN